MSNLNEMELLDEPIEYDPSAEPEGLSKIEDGVYLLELTQGKFGVKPRAGKKGVYVEAHVQGTIVDPGGRYNNFRCSGFLNNNTFDDGTSQIQQLLVHAGDKTGYATARELVAGLESLLSSKPQLHAGVRWEARAKTPEGKWLRAKGMKNFPKDDNGHYIPFITFDGVDEPAEARETIYKFVAAKGGAAS